MSIVAQVSNTRYPLSHRFGYSLPPYFYPTYPLGAHITLLPPLRKGEVRGGGLYTLIGTL